MTVKLDLQCAGEEHIFVAQQIAEELGFKTQIRRSPESDKENTFVRLLIDHRVSINLRRENYNLKIHIGHKKNFSGAKNNYVLYKKLSHSQIKSCTSLANFSKDIKILLYEMSCVRYSNIIEEIKNLEKKLALLRKTKSTAEEARIKIKELTTTSDEKSLLGMPAST